MQRDPAQVDVVVRLATARQGDPAVDDGEVGDQLSQPGPVGVQPRVQVGVPAFVEDRLERVRRSGLAGASEVTVRSPDEP